MNILADGAPTGAGLAIVGAILLVFLAICFLIAFFVIRGLVRAFRRRGDSEVAGSPGSGPPQLP